MCVWISYRFMLRVAVTDEAARDLKPLYEEFKDVTLRYPTDTEGIQVATFREILKMVKQRTD